MSELINNITANQDKPGLQSKYSKNKVQLRVAALELAARANTRVPEERKVSSRAVLLTVERSLAASASLKPRTREFLALKHVTSFLALAIDGSISENSTRNRDLLPVGHPLSTRAHHMSEAALNSATARWFAADPRIDDSVRELVASAYESPLGSIEYRHSLARINALTAGLVPQDVLISIQPSALVAAGGNSTAARSARANMQRRDRKGQFAFQGGGFQFFLRGLDGKVSSVSGRFVANSDTTDGFHVEVKGDKILQDGLYDVPASKAEAIKAVLPDAPQQDKVSLPSGVEAVDLAEVKPLDAPAGWELVSTKKPGEAGPDKVFKSGDGYIVEYYEPGNESTKDAASSAWKSNTAPGSSLTDPPNLINSKGETGMKGKLQSDQPVYILKRDPDAGNTKSNKKAVAITQSWYDTQNEAGKDEKAFDNDIQAKIDQEGSVAKDQKASLEKAQADKADKDKANKPIQDANAQTASEVQANLDSGKDAYGNPLPEGWTVSKNELNPMQTDSQGNAVPIDKSKAATYSRTEQNIPMSVSHNDDGSLNFNGESAKSWDDVEAATPDYVKGKIDENRSAVKESVKKFDTDGKVADIIDNGGGADEINAELQKNEVWKAAQEDLSTSAFVDAPSKVQKDKWAELEKNNKDIRDILPPYEDTSKPEPKAFLPESSSEKISAGSKSQSAPSTPPTPGTPEFVTPDGAYKLQSPEDFEPQGRDGEDSTNYTDDPEVLSNRFSEQELSNALMQATIGVNDPTKDLIAELEDIDTDAPEDDEADTKKKPGPKKKKEKPQQTNNASGSGSLEFNAGEEWVPAEAIYNALKNQGVDADMLLAKIYDSALGDSTNVSALTKSNKEDTINAQSPTPALDAFEGTEEDTMQKLNVELAGVDKASIAVVQTDDFRKKNNGEPNPKIVDLATQIRGIQKDGKGHYKILEDNIELAFSDDPQDREAFQSLWGLMTALDYGYTSNLAGVEGLDSDLLDNTELMQAVSSAIESYNGSSPTGEELDAFITENGTYLDFLNSKANIVNGDEEVGGDSLASGYYRLLAENSRYNDTTLYRGIQVPRNSEDLAQLIGKGNVVAFDGRPFTNDGTTASSFAGVMYAGDNGNDGVIFSIAPMKGKAADVQQVSPFADENELPVLGNYKITKVTSVKQPTGRTIHKVEVEKLDKRSSVLEGYDSDYEPLLIVDNSSPTMPEGYYEIGAAAYTPTAPEDRDPGLPEDFDDSPVTIARQWEKADLADAFRSAIEDGSGKTILVYPDGYEATIDVEAVRDALQIQGVDTNSLLDDIASAAPDAGASTEESKPVESSVGSSLDSIIKDVSQIYEINGWKKVGPQLGSNEGGMTKSPEGDQYYVKTPKSELHAQNETLAAALYRLAGVDAAEVYMGKDENGKLKTFTPDINGKQDLANNLNNPEYLAKLQDGFAVDAWLGNWDVAGLAYDNVMTNENGDPVRVDPGGALLFRAMGAPKGSLFGSEVNELDSLRDPNMNQQSYTVFGSMTDEQQKESARKLLSVSNDDINNMVDSIITDDKSATELKDKLAARRQYILDRYDLSSEDSSLLVDNAGTPDDSVEEDLGVQSPEAHTKEVDSRMSIASGWADEYSTDKKLVNLSVDRKNFATIAEQIDVALKDWRNGEISDEELPGVLNELDDFIDSFTYNDDSSASAADDLQDQLRSLQTYIKDHNKQNGVEEPTPEEPAPSVDTPVDDIPNNPYKDSQGTPIVEGQKLKYKKNDVEEVGTFNRYDKNQTYVWVKFDDGKKAKAISTKYLTVVDEGGGDEGSKAPEAPPSKEDLSPGAELPSTKQPTANSTTEAPFVDEPFLNAAADDLIKTFAYGLPDDGEILAVNEKDGSIAVAYDNNVIIFDGKKKTNFVPQASPDFFKPGATGVEVFGWRPLTDEENTTLLKKIEDNAVPYGTIKEDVNQEGADLNEIDGPASPNEYTDELTNELAKTEDLLDSLVEDEEMTADLKADIENNLMKVWSHVAAIEEISGSWTDIDRPPKDVVAKAVASYKAIDSIREDVIPTLGVLDKQLVSTQQVLYSQLINWGVDPNLYNPGEETPNIDADADADIDTDAENASTPTPPPGAMTAADSKGNLIWSGMEITDKDGNTGTVIKVNKDNYAFVKFPDGTTKWRSSKSVVGSGNVSAGASNLPIGSKGYTKVTGAGVAPVKVENPSDWSSSDFEAVPSLDSAIKKTMDTSDKSNAARGASAAVDSDSIEDLDVRFTHEVNAEGSEVLKAKFKLTNWAAKARIKEILAMNDKELAANGITITENVRVPATKLNAEGLITSSSNDNYLYTSSLGRTYTIKTSDKVTIKIFRANKDDTTKFINTFSNGAPKALHNLVTIEAPVDATPEMIASAIQNAGVSEVRPATEADARILKENRLMSVFDAKTDANINLKGTQREESLQRIKDRYDITVDDVEVSIGNSGRIETRLSEEGAAKVVEATGSPNALRHTLTFRGYSTYEKAKTLFDLLTNPQGGLLSTTARWSEGTSAVGQSSAHDISTGGADYVFTRPISNALSEATYGAGGSGVSIHLNPLKMYQRLDFYANQGDKYGKRFKANDVISSARVGAYEVMFKGRVGFDLADRIIVSQDVYNELMPLFAAKGITEIAGVPIDQLIVKPTG